MQDGSSSSSLLSCGRRNVNKRASIPACTQTRHFLFLLAGRFGSVFYARSLSLSVGHSHRQRQSRRQSRKEIETCEAKRDPEGPEGGGPRLFDFFL